MLATVAVLAGTAAGLALPAPAAAQPRYMPDEPAIALASPATVYLEERHTGYVRDAATGAALHAQPIEFERVCSGVVVNPDGYALTTSVCVRPSAEVVLVNALYKLGRTRIAAGELAGDRLDGFVTKLAGTTRFTGVLPDSPALVTLSARPGRQGPAGAVTVVQALPAVQGNVALVKLDQPGLPALDLDPGHEPAPGAPVVIVGYASGDGAAPRTRSVRISGRSGTNRLRVDGEVGAYSRGGAVVDPGGRLIAILDADTSAPGSPVHDIIKASHITRLMKQAGVEARLGDTDRRYRDALDAYFSGRYSRAVAKFDDLLRVAPSHAAAREYRERARERLAVDGDATANHADWLMYAASAAGGVLVLAGIGAASRLLRRLVSAGVRDPVRASAPDP